jgi:hypothetical protein
VKDSDMQWISHSTEQRKAKRWEQREIANAVYGVEVEVEVES